MFFGGGFPFGDFGNFHQEHEEEEEDNEPVDNETYYMLLEVDKDATTEQIKKSFKKKAMKMHPDKGGDPEAFQELSVAHDVLSDPEKRKIYDKYGEKGIKQGMGAHESQFGDLFDMLNGGFGKQQKPQRAGQQRTRDLLYPLRIDLEDVYLGGQSKIQVSRRKLCEKCAGAGGKSKQECTDCKGRGIVIKLQQLGPGMYTQAQMHCSSCRGEGTIIQQEDKCEECNGEGTKEEQKELTCDIAQGVPDGYRYSFYGESNEAEGCIPGDIIVEVQVNEHERFKRKGFDLIYKSKINLSEALAGFKMQITHLDGKPRCVIAQPGEIITPGDVKTVQHLGLPKFTTPYEFGNLFIYFEVEFPIKGSLSELAIQNLRKALPPSTYQDSDLPTDPKMIYSTQDFSENDLNPLKDSRGGEAYEEDDYRQAKDGRVNCHQM